MKKELLQTACNDVGIPFLKPLYAGKTRFGSQEKTAQRCVDLKSAISTIPDVDVSAATHGCDSDEDDDRHPELAHLLGRYQA